MRELFSKKKKGWRHSTLYLPFGRHTADESARKRANVLEREANQKRRKNMKRMTNNSRIIIHLWETKAKKKHQICMQTHRTHSLLLLIFLFHSLSVVSAVCVSRCVRVCVSWTWQLFSLMFLLDNSFVKFTSYHYRHRCQHNEQRNWLPFSLKAAQEKENTFLHSNSCLLFFLSTLSFAAFPHSRFWLYTNASLVQSNEMQSNNVHTRWAKWVFLCKINIIKHIIKCLCASFR